MPDIKTTFIPKKQLGTEKKRKTRAVPVGALLFVSIILFLVSVVAYGGLFLYSALLERNIEAKSQAIERARQVVEPRLVASLARFDERIDTARELLDNHTVISPLFRELEQSTLQTVSFDRFDYQSLADGTIQLTLTGEAKNYTSLALQSDVFAENAGIQKPLFSNLRLNERGNVAFRMTAIIDKNAVLFTNIVSSIFVP